MPNRTSALLARAAAVATVVAAGTALVGCKSAPSRTNSACGSTYVVGSAQGHSGPSLVAGDMLAMKTRLAGGFDIPTVPDFGSRYAGVAVE